VHVVQGAYLIYLVVSLAEGLLEPVIGIEQGQPLTVASRGAALSDQHLAQSRLSGALIGKDNARPGEVHKLVVHAAIHKIVWQISIVLRTQPLEGIPQETFSFQPAIEASRRRIGLSKRSSSSHHFVTWQAHTFGLPDPQEQVPETGGRTET
jgi:hypothetical protein